MITLVYFLTCRLGQQKAQSFDILNEVSGSGIVIFFTRWKIPYLSVRFRNSLPNAESNPDPSSSWQLEVRVLQVCRVHRESSCIYYLTPIQWLGNRPRHTRAAAGQPHPAHRARLMVGARRRPKSVCVSRQLVVAGPLRVRILCRRRGRDPSALRATLRKVRPRQREGARCGRRVGRERIKGS